MIPGSKLGDDSVDRPGKPGFREGSGARTLGDINLLFYERDSEEHLNRLFQKLTVYGIDKSFAAIFTGIPANENEIASKQLARIVKETAFSGALFDYRKFFGQFATSSAVAAAYALTCIRKDSLPSLIADRNARLTGRGILLLGLGRTLSAIEITP